jgi:hypothetical protein
MPESRKQIPASRTVTQTHLFNEMKCKVLRVFSKKGNNSSLLMFVTFTALFSIGFNFSLDF